MFFKANEELLAVRDPETLHFNTALIAYTSRVFHVGGIMLFVP